ncbi:MAG: hypothetical protein ACRC8Z_03915 [Empedobacter falsenii]
MSLIDDFLEIVTDECGNKIDFSNIEVEGFEGLVCFGENYAEINIKEDSFWLGKYELFESQKEMLTEFVNYVQQKMKDHRQISEDDIKTKNSLYNWGKF